MYLSDGTTGVQIEGNYIGVNATGTAALGNQGNGVLIGGPSGAAGNNTGGSADNTIGGTTAGNVISGNSGDGVEIGGSGTTGNVVEGNYIGGNALDGVYVTSGARATPLAVRQTGAANLIAYNTGAGIAVDGRGLHRQSDRGQLHPRQRRPGDRSCQRRQRQPGGPGSHVVLRHCRRTNGQRTFGSVPNATFRLEFFANTQPDPSGFGEGQTFLVRHGGRHRRQRQPPFLPGRLGSHQQPRRANASFLVNLTASLPVGEGWVA